MLGDEDEVVVENELRGDDASDPAQVRASLAVLPSVNAVGHRIVHGGARFLGPVRIDGEVRNELDALCDLAPLHQPKSLAALDVVADAYPDADAVACFDTAFHATLPPAARTYALPAQWRHRFGLRRYGFHGLSHAYVVRRVAELVGTMPKRLISCHLGAGASLAAVLDGRCVDTTMGFTPIEGLVMATRSGSVDPGMLLWLEEHAGTPSSALADALEHRSGLVGLCGTDRMEEVIERSQAGDDTAVLALEVYLHRLRGAIAQMAASMGGVDAIAFTGGVGEHAPIVRAGASDGLGFLGLLLDDQHNRRAIPDAEISAADSHVQAFVLRAREDLEIAREVRSLLSGLPARRA